MFKPFRSILHLGLVLQFKPFKTRSSPKEATKAAWEREQNCYYFIYHGMRFVAVQVQ